MTEDHNVSITFRRLANQQRAVLLPMVNGIDVPDVLNCTIEEGVNKAQVTIVCNLPRGVVVET